MKHWELDSHDVVRLVEIDIPIDSRQVRKHQLGGIEETGLVIVNTVQDGVGDDDDIELLGASPVAQQDSQVSPFYASTRIKVSSPRGSPLRKQQSHIDSIDSTIVVEITHTRIRLR